jgi:hypothetical protein
VEAVPVSFAPGLVLRRLEEIEHDLATRQNVYEAAALAWFRAKRDKERARAIEFMKATGTVAERNAVADRETALMGVEAEAEYEALRAVIRVLETRASVAQSVLKSQGREAYQSSTAAQPAWSGR